jgi:ribonuclease HI
VTTAAVLMFDGGARPPDNGEAAIGFTLQIKGEPRREYSQRIGKATCNEAEYQSLIGGLSTALEIGVDEITVRGDSQLVVRQLKDEWKTREPRLRVVRDEAIELIGQFDTFEIEHISRVENSVADSLVERAFR